MSASIFQHAITGILLTLALGWFWRTSARQPSRLESGRTVFPPTKVAQAVMIAVGVLFATLTIASSFLARKPGEWWVPFLFLGFVLLALFGYPPLLRIEVDGVESRTWYGNVKKIRWEDIVSLHYNTGNKQFTIRDRQGRKITHAGFNADPWGFRSQIQKCTRLPLQMSKPGLWQAKTFELPYDDEQEQATNLKT